MKRLPALATIFAASLLVSACSKEPDEKPASTATGTERKVTIPEKKTGENFTKVPVLPGYKYYTGGPRLSKDQYGRYRIAGFETEVPTPPDKGMVFGVLRDGDKIEYKVWGNGLLLGYNRGVMKDGFFWKEYAESYRKGHLTAREYYTNLDAEKRTKLVTENLDPENGEVIRTKESYILYTPPVLKIPGQKPGDDELEDFEEEEDGATATPPAATPPPAAGTQ
jgi:hypothetical protein